MRANDHSGAEVGQRRAIHAERECGLVPAAQVLGLRALPEATEVDDPLDPLGAGHAGERHGRGPLTAGEVLGSSPTHRVDQVVRHVHILAGAAQRLWSQHVSLVQIEARALERAGAGPAAVAHQATYLWSRACQSRGEATADEPGRAGDQHACAHAALAPEPSSGASAAASRAALPSSKPPTSLARTRPEGATISTAVVSGLSRPRSRVTFRTSV